MGELSDVDKTLRCCCFLGKPVLVFTVSGQAVLTASGHEELFRFRPRTRHKSAVNYKVDIINLITCVENRQVPTFPDWVSAVL